MLKKFLLSVFTLVILAVTFSACGRTDNGVAVTNEKPTKSLVLLIQNTANTASPMITDSEVSNTVYDTIRSSGTTTIIMVDGDPYTVDKISADIPENVSEAKKISIAKQVTKQVLSAAGSAVPKTGEVDVLKGLIMAARNLDASCDEKTVLYLGSGLQTIGYLPFATQNLLETDPELILAQLTQKSAIPNFPDGTKVVFAGLGDTAAPQKNLTYSQIENLKQIINSICKAGGAEVEYITGTPVMTTDSNPAFPTVSTVTVPDDFVEGGTISGTLKIDSTQISFLSDSYELTDESAAVEFLTPYVAAINNSDDIIYVCGTTATADTDEACRAFSLKRAQTIVDLLVQLGVDPSRLMAKGLGYDNVFHVVDTDENGSLIESAAQKNRLVLIIPSSCEDAKKLS